MVRLCHTAAGFEAVCCACCACAAGACARRPLLALNGTRRPANTHATHLTNLPPCSKWYGDSNKLVSAVWSLAYKLQPCILFIGAPTLATAARPAGQPAAP